MKYLQAHRVSSHDKRYAYACGRIRALEMRLLGRQRLERIAEARDLDEALRLLSDTDYAAHFDEIEVIGYVGCLYNELRRVLDLIDALSLDPEVTDILRLKYDFHNLKVAIREKVSGRDLSHLYFDFGRFLPDELRAPLKADNLDGLPPFLIEPATVALERVSRSLDPSEGDTVIDRSMFTLFLERAKAYGSIYLEALVRTWIDLANVRTFMRARFLGVESRSFPDLLIPEGFIRLSDLRETFALPLDEVRQRFEFSPYRGIIEIGGGAIEKEGTFVELEREIDNYLISFLHLTRYFTFGLEIILAYGLLKENEIRMLRLILAAKERGVAAEALKGRIANVE